MTWIQPSVYISYEVLQTGSKRKEGRCTPRLCWELNLGPPYWRPSMLMLATTPCCTSDNVYRNDKQLSTRTLICQNDSLFQITHNCVQIYHNQWSFFKGVILNSQFWLCFLLLNLPFTLKGAGPWINKTFREWTNIISFSKYWNTLRHP